MNLLAIEIGGTKLQIFAGDAAAQITQRRRFSVDPAQGGAGIRREIQAALAELLPVIRPSAIGVGFGGPVDWRTGRICCSHQVEGWHQFELGRWLQEIARVPVVVENDSNAATLGEAWHGAGVGKNPVFYFNMGSGVGGGLVLNGEIFHGATPGETEFGHLRLDQNGTTVEARCSGWAVDRKVRAVAARAPASVLGQLVGRSSGGEARHLATALQMGDLEAQRLLDETAEDLAFPLSHAVHLFHPEIIVMGGGLALLGESLRGAVESRLKRHVMAAFAPGPPVRLTGLGEDAVVVGALLLAQRSLGHG